MSRRSSRASSWSEFAELAGLAATGAVLPLVTVLASRDSLPWLTGLCLLTGTAGAQGELLRGEPDTLHRPLLNGLIGLLHSVVKFAIAMCVRLMYPCCYQCLCTVDV